MFNKRGEIFSQSRSRKSTRYLHPNPTLPQERRPPATGDNQHHFHPPPSCDGKTPDFVILISMNFPHNNLMKTHCFVANNIFFILFSEKPQKT
jgi:hypothetical protein